MADFQGESALGDWTLAIQDVGAEDEGELEEWCLILALLPPPPPFLRGDADGDGSVDAIPDAVFLLSWQFLLEAPPPCFDAADIDDDGTLYPLVDALFLLRWQFLGAAEPPVPGPRNCGDDASNDLLRCERAPEC